MKLTINREPFLNALQSVIGVVERRQTLPVLANVLVRMTEQRLFLTGSDMEVELISHLPLESGHIPGEITVPGRKLLDITRSLPVNASLDIQLQDQHLVIRSGKSRFTLTTLPASEFPTAAIVSNDKQFSLSQNELLLLLERSHFAMAQQDVRYFLNGLLLELEQRRIRMVATDGHRLALSDLATLLSHDSTQVIIPRKGVTELLRLLKHNDERVTVNISAQAVTVATDDFIFTSRLIDGRFPEYDRVLPKGGDKIVILDRDMLNQVLNRVAILSNEKYRVVRVKLKPGVMIVAANNQDQEQAEEEIEIDYQGAEIDINFNVNYLIDAVSALPEGNVKLTLLNADTGVTIEGVGVEDALYIVMPLRI